MKVWGEVSDCLRFSGVCVCVEKGSENGSRSGDRKDHLMRL